MDGYELALEADPIEDFPIDLATLKVALKIDHDSFDALIQNQHLPAAIVRAETFMRRAVMSRTHRWIISELPCGYDQTLYLPRGKVSAVSKIEVSVGGVIETLRGATSGSPAGTDYQEDLRGDRARLMPARGETWPSADCDVVSPVVVTFTAGYAVGSVPEEIIAGIISAVGEALDISPSDQVGTFPGVVASASNYADVQWSPYRLLA